MGLMSNNNKLKYLLGILFFAILTASFVRSSFDVLKSKDRLDNVNKEVALLEQEKQEIEKEIELKKSDAYVEEKARNDLNLIKPGEKVFVVRGGESALENVLAKTDARTEDEKKAPNWYSWYRLFFDN